MRARSGTSSLTWPDIGSGRSLRSQLGIVVPEVNWMAVVDTSGVGGSNRKATPKGPPSGIREGSTPIAPPSAGEVNVLR